MIEGILITMNKYITYIIRGIIGVSLGLGLEVQAESITFQQAPLIYEYNLKGPISMESEIITTTGTITSISAYAESEGEVRLEVSATGGSSYTRIINGLPLKDGFIPGNQLRFKASISEGSILKKLVLGYTDTSGLSRLFQNLDLRHFKSRKSIHISPGSRELFNYPVKIKIERDVYEQGIYFTCGDGQTPLPYYLEAQDLFWIKIPQIPREGLRIYLYYGNKEEKINSQGEEVFSFFDGFESDLLDKEKWQVRSELKGRYALEEGYLKLAGCSVISRDFKMKRGILEFKAKAEKDSAIQAIAHGTLSAHSGYPQEEMVYSSGYPGAEHTIAMNDVVKVNIGKPIEPLKDYIYKVIIDGVGIIFERYVQDYEKQAEIRFLDSYRDQPGYIGLRADDVPFSSGGVYFDWVRVRPYVEVEPEVKGER